MVQEGPPLTVFDVNFLAPKLGINVREREGDGVVVVATIAGDIDPSILAKLKPGDVIHALNDESIKDRGISSREDIIKAIKDTPTRPLKISFIRESDSTSASASTSFSEEVPEAEVTVDKVVEDDGTPRQAGDDAAAEDEDAGETDHAVSKLAMAKDETQEEELEVSDGAWNSYSPSIALFSVPASPPPPSLSPTHTHTRARTHTHTRAPTHSMTHTTL